MDSGNGSNQAQRYCPTPIMAPPTVATSPPLMSGGSVIGTMHQPASHHPPPSISPHPSAYYGHHQSGGNHYPTPSPTPPPPPMHHQQYYAHSYYAHGSHQQHQQQAQQQSQPAHHGLSNTNSHASMNTQNAAAAQQTHMMGHSSYPHHQSHHQQWAAPTPPTHPPHQQQSHHYYHHPTHQPPSHQQQPHQQQAPQQQQQQHVYPPPPQSPYQYMPPHPTPTPPPTSSHPGQQQQQQQHMPQATVAPPQPQHPPPPAPPSSSPAHIHSASQQQQSQQPGQPPSHALMNLSRFVSQQSSTSSSPRASPSMGSHHGQQIPSHGSQSPSTFSGHMDHHSSMNGHPGHSPSISSPPPPQIQQSVQQPMSPPPQHHPPTPQVTQHHHVISQPQTHYNVNPSNGPSIVGDRTNNMNITGNFKSERDNTNFQSDINKSVSRNPTSSEQLRPPVSLPYATTTGAIKQTGSECSNDHSSKVSSLWNEKDAGKGSGMSQTTTTDHPNSFSSNTMVQKDTADERPGSPDFIKPNGSISESSESVNGPASMENGNSRASVSPPSPSKPLGSPSSNSSGNGHQMMPVRLQNVQMGARTKASMKKLMQEQHNTTSNGQITETQGEPTNAKDVEVQEEVKSANEASKTPKGQRKRKSQKSAPVSDPPGPSNAEIPLSSDADLSAASLSGDAPVRPGYTKSGKKIGRPRKDSVPGTGGAEAKSKGKKKGGATQKKAKEKVIPSETAISDVVVEQGDANVSAKDNSRKRKATKSPKKKPVDTPVETIATEESLQLTTTDLSTTTSGLESSQPIDAPMEDEGQGVRSKRRKKTNKDISSEDSSLSDSIPQTMPTSSEISDQEAKSVALRVIQPSASASSPKGRRRKGQSEESEIAPEKVTQLPEPVSKRKTKRQSAASLDLIEPTTSPERGELPRLRSRSPKQRESPPLRISSPRAAKERSTTPAGSTTSTSVSSRSRASKEKEVVQQTSTPAGSPTTRSPKKSPEKDTAITAGTSNKRRKNLMEDLESCRETILSPPPSKRTRQVSKESSDAGESSVVKSPRKSRQSEIRASTESDIVPSLPSPDMGKRSTRRKSGSVSTDDLSSSGFRSPNSFVLLPPTEALGESPADVFTGYDASLSVETTPMHTSTPMVQPKRGKGKKATKTKSKASLISSETIDDSLTVNQVTSELEPEVSSVNVSNEPTTNAPKQKKSKKSPAKKGAGKGKKAAAANNNLIAATSNELVSSQEVADLNEPVDPNAELNAPEIVKPIGKKGKKATTSAKVKKEKSKPGVIPAVLNIPKPAALTVPKKKGRPRVQKPTKSSKAKKGKDPVVLKEEEESFPQQPQPGTSVMDESTPFAAPIGLTSPKRRRSSAASSVNTQPASAKSGISNVGFDTPPSLSFKSEGQASIGGGSNSSGVAKLYRRDSRSMSREYDVSVVLTDICHSWSSSNSPSGAAPVTSNPLQSSSVSIEQPQGNNNMESMNDGVKGDPAEAFNSTLDTSVTISIPKGKKRQSKAKVPKPPKPPKAPKEPKKPRKSKAQKNQEQKSTSDVEEVAQILLNLNKESPVKSAPVTDTSDTSPPPPKKARKPRKSKKATAQVAENGEVQNSDQQLFPVTADNTSLTPAPVTTKKKTKSKKSKEIVAPAIQPVPQSSLQSFVSSFSGSSSSGVAESPSQSINVASTSVTPNTSVKVVRTAQIPTASSLGIPEQSLTDPIPVAASKKKPKKEKAAKGKMGKGGPPPNTEQYSPDITTFSSKRKASPKKATKKSLKASINSAATAISEDVSKPEVVTQEGNPEVVESAEEPKKKRQRKTSSPSKSKSKQLFPYTASPPPPAKKPTVMAKTVPGIVVEKEDDNQKKRSHEAPTLRVIGGKTKFYRGGEEEELDQDPKLPKEKGPLQTDNAVPWECSFCHLGPHAQKLGDLFGPYFANLPSIYGMPSMKRETWMHGDCALWAGRLILVGTYLRRLEETLQNADKETCTICKKTGATIGCLKRGCKEAVHYPCAIRKFWKMDGEKFHSYCPSHKDKAQ